MKEQQHLKKLEIFWNLLKTLNGHASYVLSLAVLPDNKLASGFDDKTIKIWDTKSGKELKTLNGHAGLTVQKLCFHITTQTTLNSITKRSSSSRILMTSFKNTNALVYQQVNQ